MFHSREEIEAYTKNTILISRHFNLERGLVLNDLLDLTLNITYKNRITRFFLVKIRLLGLCPILVKCELIVSKNHEISRIRSREP